MQCETKGCNWISKQFKMLNVHIQAMRGFYIVAAEQYAGLLELISNDLPELHRPCTSIAPSLCCHLQ